MRSGYTIRVKLKTQEKDMRLRTSPQHFAQFNIAVLLLASSFASAKAGQLDTTFANGGLLAVPTGKSAENAVAIQSDGKIVVAGVGVAGNDLVDTLVRVNPDGSLDNSFGTGGIVDIAPPGHVDIDGIFGVAIQPDGKILAAAAALNGVLVARVEANGSLDTSFGSGGFTSNMSFEVAAGNLALQADGKILMVAGFGNPSLMVRFTSSGQLDTSFGKGGVVNLDYGVPTQVAVQANGKILVTSGESGKLILLPFPTAQAGAITRYNSNGAIDKTFGAAGMAASVASASALVLQGDGKIVLGGAITSKINAPGTASDVGFGIVRYNANGSLDNSFGKGGVAITDFGATATDSGALAVAVQSNGDIVAAGAAGVSSNGSLTASSFGLSRYTSAGNIDTTFGKDGVVLTPIGNGAVSWVNALAIQSDGKIVAAGVSNLHIEFPSGYVARYLSQ
jgi:uncharacterized delta-60 repeat protein